MRLLLTPDCKNIAKQINEFENSIFPKEFYTEYDKLKHWVNSCYFFCNAILDNKDIVKSDISFLITTKKDFIRLINRKIEEFELEPTSADIDSILYFSSFILQAKSHSQILLRSIFREIKSTLRNKQIKINSCFAIGATQSGIRFSKNCKFHQVNTYKKLYPICLLNNHFAETIFRVLLQ